MKRFLIPIIFFIASARVVEADESSCKPVTSFAIVELFTSEGCSSCPPADILLSKLVAVSKQKNIAIYPISFHVDYWNYLGWRDPFSQKQFSTRQSSYVGIFGSNSMATPEFIINGTRNVLGADGDKLQSLVNKVLNEEASAQFEVSIVSADRKGLKVSYDYSGDMQGKVINIGLLERLVEIDVGHGENAGRRMKHNNVVRVWQSISLKKRQGSIDLMYMPTKSWEDYRVVSFVQDAKDFEITAAAQIEL